ncbi:MAG TPA: hypothetical protein DCL38_08835, partial [Lachnospiraceae bacterium]|nr:hypothetical protein [Lachnospiraceae bacterium]
MSKARTVAIGIQDYGKLRESGCFYVDKTAFIREWWGSNDDVTLITRPRRFGKTLNMSMLECFFSNKYADRGDLFEGLKVWEDEELRALQGTYPVIFMTFAGVKAVSYEKAFMGIKKQLVRLFSSFPELMGYEGFDRNEKAALDRISEEMSETDAAYSINLLARLLEKYYGKKVLILLDEYDTPMQEAWVNGYWDELVEFIREMFNNSFKTNPSLERAVMTGITRVSKESIFSDLNNLNVVTTTSEEYATAFGFTEEEVFAAMDEQGIGEEEKEKVKFWYDGFTFGRVPDIYNPWSVIMYLDKRKFDTYWANTSGNGLVSKLIREGDKNLKYHFEDLLNGKEIEAKIDEQIVYGDLSGDENAIWSLLMASGYLKAEGIIQEEPEDEPLYRLKLTNFEVKRMFTRMVRGWFSGTGDYNDFIKAMLKGEEEEMNYYMNRVALNTFSSFDAGKQPSDKKEPERFYHGFVLGLMVDKAKDYVVKSNRESGFGRYDVVMEPKDAGNVAVIMEFKVRNESKGEKTLEDTAENALKQIEEKR